MDSSGDDPTAATLAWLCSSDEPAVRYLTRRYVLGDRNGAASAADAAQLLEGPKARALLAGQQPDGGFGVHPYSKWTGAHWRLVSLVELAAPAGEPRLQAAALTVLDWLTGRSHRQRVQVIGGLTRRCASQEGNALAVACRLGMAGDPRAGDALELLMRRRRVDGRWQPGGRWWRPPGTPRGSGPVEVVDWGRSGPNEMLILNALRCSRPPADRHAPPPAGARRAAQRLGGPIGRGK